MKDGFTVTEFLIVTFIIGMLAMLALPAINEIRGHEEVKNTLGLRSCGKYFYSPDTRKVVEVDRDTSKVVRQIGKIEIPIMQFEELSSSKKYTGISYIDSPSLLMKTNVQEVVVIDGITYRKEE